MWTSLRGSEKELTSKGNFRSFLILNSLKLSLNSLKDVWVTKILKEIKFGVVWEKLKAKKMFSETKIHKILMTNSSFNITQRTAGKV